MSPRTDGIGLEMPVHFLPSETEMLPSPMLSRMPTKSLKRSLLTGRRAADMSASYQSATRAEKVGYRSFAPRAVGPLRADTGHPRFSLRIPAS